MYHLWGGKTLERTTMWTLSMSRSHYSTRWEILNVGVQCISCNIFKHGQQYLFSKYLDKTFGEGTSNELFLKSQTLGKFTTNEIEEMIKKYKDLLDELE